MNKLVRQEEKIWLHIEAVILICSDFGIDWYQSFFIFARCAVVDKTKQIK